MLLILLTWIYMFFVFSVQGEYINKLLFNGKLHSIGETTLLGMIFQAVLITVVAFFYRINIEYFCCNTLLTFILAFLNRSGWFSQLRKNLYWSRFSIILFILIVIAASMRSSMLPFLIDNESYYQQTIKWLNEYGWVKGLANLHVFLIHGSPWHALQAGYNFNFISGIFNDINGFLLCIMVFLWVDKINELRKKADYQTNRWLFFLPVFLIFWFQFVDSPSVDLPLFLITLLVIYYTLNRSDEGDLLAVILLIFLVFVKVTIAPVLILLLFLVRKKNLKFVIPYALILGFVYIAKGIWLSGIPLAPYPGFSVSLPWTLPPEIRTVLMEAPIFKKDNFNFQSIGSNDLVDIGLALVEILTCIVYILMVLRKKRKTTKFIEQYPVLFFFVLEMLFVFLFFIQFRFLLPAFFYPFAFILSKIKLSPRLLSVMIYCFILLVAIPVLFKFDYGKLSNHPHLLIADTFQIENVFKPAGITKYKDLTFKKTAFTNFDYYNPEDETRFLFLMGNGPLPCVKTDYLYQMYLRTGCVPALIGEGLGEGFYSVNIRDE